jgi:hypothetical protein
MKVAAPEVSRYTDPTGKVRLEIPVPVSGKPARLYDGKPHVWPGSTPLLSKLVFVPQRRLVALVGGLGDSGSDLGRIEVRSYEGEVKAQVDLTQAIPDLEKLSKVFELDMGNFPWIESVGLSADASVLGINVCRRFAALIDLTTFQVDVEPLADPGAPSASRGPPKPVMPLVLDGVRYDPALGDDRHLPTQRIAAYDVATGKELWRVEVYRQRYAPVPGLETDVQDVFITGLAPDPKGGGLLITDERGRRYRVDLKTHASTRLPGVAR